MKRMRVSLGSLLIALLAGCMENPGTEEWDPPAAASEAATPAPREPCAHRDPLRQPFFGDLHVHTGYSMDARSRNVLTTPDDAYRFARGEPIPGLRLDLSRESDDVLRIDRPLDFAAVTDHAEWLGETRLCTDRASVVYDTTSCRIYRGEDRAWRARLLGLNGPMARLVGVLDPDGRNREVCGDDLLRCRSAARTVWDEIRSSAEAWYDRSASCEFTTFHGWEYSRSPDFTKIHRNVILRNEIAPELPLSWIDTPTEPEFWRRLREVCNDAGSGCEAVAIPHNPNLSNGQLFSIWYRELPLEEQREQAKLRAGLEPIVEMIQVKGESECRNGMFGVVGEEDELCDFEKARDFPAVALEDCGEGSGVGARRGRGCISRLDYVRYALIEGLRERDRIGTNPYRFGLIGSTDTHMSNPGSVEERSYVGPYRASPNEDLVIAGRVRASIYKNPGGLAGLWAEENSRDSLFDALLRREAFATSGPRITPRFFGGFDLPTDLCERGDFVEVGYRDGVPMGGELSSANPTAPRFAALAARDPGSTEVPGTPLQRIQIIKGWVGADGAFHQSVHDVAGDAANGARVDPGTCERSGPGADRLCAVWQDPDFDPAVAAVYYARVVENPSCRWSTWRCLALPEDERPDGCADARVPKTIQERAWTSPIWYEPPS